MANVTASAVNLPLEGMGLRSASWWGMLCLIATEAILFVYLIFSYAYLGAQSPGRWPPTGPPSMLLSGPDTIVLLASSFVLLWGVRAFDRRHGNASLRIALIITFLMGVAFVAVQGLEWRNKPFSFDASSYSAIYFTMTGIHMAHVAVGLVILAALFVWSLAGRLGGRHQHLMLGALYWHFVDAVWIAVFTTIYLIPRLS
jgi:cytochrome c oxidase subunit III